MMKSVHERHCSIFLVNATFQNTECMIPKQLGNEILPSIGLGSRSNGPYSRSGRDPMDAIDPRGYK